MSELSRTDQDLFASALQRARIGEGAEAKALCQDLLSREPENYSARSLLSLLDAEFSDDNLVEQGRLCLTLGRLHQAVRILEDAARKWPEQALPVALQGTAQRLLGRASDALDCYESALILDPEEAHALVGQAVLLWQRGNSSTALDRLRRIVEQSPDNLDAQMTLGDVLFDRGDYIEAVRHLGHLLDRHPHLLPPRQALARCLARKPVAVLALEDDRHVRESYSCPDIELENLAQASVVILLRSPELQPLWNLKAGAEACEALRSGELEEVLSHTFLQTAIGSGILSDLTLERGLTFLRWATLESLERGGAAANTSLSATAEALAQCCWLNEFAFFVSGEEIEILERLRARDDREALLGQAMYGPLTRPIEGLDSLVAWSLTEPAEEHLLAAEIPRLTPISHSVSAAVSQQYEENPYPRWRGLTRSAPMKLGHGLQSFFPHWTAPSALDRPRLLVAGCGTGRDLVTLASTWQTSGVVGIDLSLASLAYARRMSLQYGMDDIEFYQADLLALGDWEERFDAISCTGVLHHMEDPVTGWRVLSRLLRPGGVMKVALYSERARHAFVAAQDWVRKRGIPPTTEGIRDARRQLAGLPQDHPAWGATTVGDFYYTSGCRDLIFHVQEHRFSIARIAELLPQLGLKFLGFETNGEIRQRYDALFPHDGSRVDLLCWEKFEDIYPATFLTMYQFWCQQEEPVPSEEDPGAPSDIAGAEGGVL